MRGIKELMGLLYWIDNGSMPALEAVAKGEKKLPKNKMEIIAFLEEQKKAGNLDMKDTYLQNK